MFIEPRPSHPAHNDQIGWIEVICGSMFSGKTEELIRRVTRALIARQEVKIFKPSLDVRYDEVKVVSHNQNTLISTPVQSAQEILYGIDSAKVIAIDEAQFFEADLVDVCTQLANQGKRVIISGLDMDFEGNPFGPMPQLMSIAEYVTKLHAICAQCGDTALYSYRLTPSDERVLLGEKDAYEARCRRCFQKGQKEKLLAQRPSHQSSD